MGRFALALLFCLAASPATQPTTQPHDLASLLQKVADAQNAVVKAKNAALARCRATPSYKALATEREAKSQALEGAQQNGSPQDRLDASSAFVKVDQAVKKMEADAIANDLEVRGAQDHAFALKVEADGLAAEQEARKEADAKAAKEKIDNDPIKVAIREGKLILGMDQSEAREAIAKSLKQRYSSPNLLVQLEPSATDEDDLHIVTFTCTVLNLGGGVGGRELVRIVTCEFKDGKLVHFRSKGLDLSE